MMKNTASTSLSAARIVLSVALLATVFAICVLWAGVACAQPAQAATQTVTVSGTYKQSDARSIRAMINSLRTGSNAWYWNKGNTKKVKCSGLSNLSYDYGLEKVAMQRAMEIAVSYSHTRPNGSKWSSAYPASQGNTARAENIAIGYGSASSVHDGWTEANEKYSGQGHRRNMLNSEVKYVGIACVEVNGCRCWVEEFSSAKISTASTAALNGTGSRSVQISNPVFGVKLNPSTQIDLELECTGETSAALPKACSYVKTGETWSYMGYVPLSDSVSWSSSSASIAKIGGNSVLAVKAGTAMLTAKCAARGKSASITVKVAAHTHSWGAWATIKKPTCITSGSEKRVCRKNPTHVQTQNIAALGHKSVADYAVAATCATAGKTAGSHCRICGAVITAQKVIPAKGHAYGAPTYKWSSDKKACTATRVCSSNRSHVETETVNATGCVKQAPTCSQYGATTYTATFANPAFGSRTAGVSDIPPAGHNYRVQKTVAPTCTSPGYTLYGCANCQNTKVDDRTAATGHSFGMYASDENAMCSADGTKSRTCSHCGVKQTVKDPGSALGHDYVAVAGKAPTCSKKGWTEGKACSRCGHVHTARKAIAATGHTRVMIPAVPATHERTGLTCGVRCSTCGKTLVKQKKTAKLVYADDDDWDDWDYWNSHSKRPQVTCSKTVFKAKVKALKRRGRSFKVKALSTSGAKVTFKKLSGSKRISVGKNGKLAVKKGTKRGTYRIKVRLHTKSAYGSEAASKVVMLQVRVR